MTLKTYILFIGLTLLQFLSGCGTDDTSHIFTKLDEKRTGITFKNQLVESDQFNVLNYNYFYNGGGVAIGDINNDGLQDILFTGNMVKNQLYLNKGNFKFEDITARSGVADKQGWCTGATMVDLNGDGKLDIYICRSADAIPERRRNLLYINNGDLTFTERATEYGLADQGYSTQAAFFDYDKDGDLDMFLINHSLQKYSSGAQEHPGLRDEYNADFSNRLYRNDNGHYLNVTTPAGITSNVLTFGLGLAISDVNSDGWPDVYVSNDFDEPDYLFLNNKNGTFTESLAQCMDQVSLHSMGSDFADYNNDGYPDLLTLDRLAEDNETQKMHIGAENFDSFHAVFKKNFYYQYSRNMLQKNNGDGTFSEIGQLAGISNTNWSWSALFTDFDNDGNKDLFISNGYVKDYTDMDFAKYTIERAEKEKDGTNTESLKDFMNSMPSLQATDYVFQNKGDGTFTRKTTEWGLGQKGVSSGAAYADLDNDGDMDLVVNNINDFASIIKNNIEQTDSTNFIRVQLKGDAKNEFGIGARVVVYCKNDKYFQEEMPVRGFQSSVDPVLNFGLGKHATIDSITVMWPDDRKQVLRNVKANQTLVIKIADAKGRYSTFTTKPDTYFDTATAFGFVHRENNYNDFSRQPLLPNFLSRQGPCIAKADINKDGREDIFFGGAKGQASEIFIQQPNGEFVKKAQPAIAKDSSSEDVAAIFFDADGDGDVDLYVGSGGYEFTMDDFLLKDRLYLNDGSGNFTRKMDALPNILSSTSCVTAADMDADGDLDLFVGSRLMPGNYPVTPESKILFNDGKGNFMDATQFAAPLLLHMGMVTDASWIDINGDKYPDLVIVGEWMPVKVFINQNGKLVDSSSSYIKFESSGWWSRIIAEDFDGDGDKDLVIGNLGLNAQFHANDNDPVSIYFKDFDGNGSIDPIFCYYINGVSYPAALRDELTEQLPSLKKKFVAYRSYASATINEVFTPDELKDAGVLKATMLSTIYLQNNGTKGFTKKELPIEAQYSPVYGMASIDVNGDGKKDLVLAGNNSWTRIRFGRYTANHGMLFLADGKGGFNYVPQWKSGLSIREDVRSLQEISAGGHRSLLFGINDGMSKTVRLK